MPQKKQWNEEEIQAMVRMAERSPNLISAFDNATNGAVSAALGADVPGHGGRREGAGRPALPDEEKASERLMVRLTPGELERVLACRDDGEKKGTAAKRLLMWAVEQVEKEQGDE